MISLEIITGVCLFIATVSAHVSGSTLEATEGQNLTIPFQCDLERVGSARIIFEKSLIGRFCSDYEAASGCESMETDGVSLQVEGGNVSLILRDVNMSRSGLYEAEAYFGKHVCKKNATLVVNEASSAAPPQISIPKPAAPPQTSAPKPHTSIPIPFDSHHLLWLVVLIPLIIVILGGVFFSKLRRILCYQEKEVKTSCCNSVSVDMNDSGENIEALPS